MEISGTGIIHLGKDLDLEELKINGNFDIIVSRDLPIVAVGKVEAPASWIGATIGYLNQAEKAYRVKIVIEDGSNVSFKDKE